MIGESLQEVKTNEKLKMAEDAKSEDKVDETKPTTSELEKIWSKFAFSFFILFFITCHCTYLIQSHFKMFPLGINGKIKEEDQNRRNH